MTKSLVYPGYFPSIHQLAVMVQCEELWFEMDDHFQKQTNRNRMYIYSPNGTQLLQIPVKHNKGIHQKTRDVKIEYSFNWQKQHWKSLEAAYRSSPFFEYFEDDLAPIYTKQYPFLMDLNLEIWELLQSLMGYHKTPQKTTEYFHTSPKEITDFRHLIDGKKHAFNNTPYHQVFEEKHGFITNLSILDLLFNEGRHSLNYLKEQVI